MKKKMGRPPIHDSPMVKVNGVQFTDEQLEALQSHPDGRNAAIREAVDEWMKRLARRQSRRKRSK